MIVCECQDCGKEFEIEEIEENIMCPYCGSGDVLVGDEND